MSVKARPIYVPFNQVNISTGNGYCADVNARFWQAERHAKGVADVAYCFKMLFQSTIQMEKFTCYFTSYLRLLRLAAIFPWIIISMNYQKQNIVPIR
jgi:hypothetical protein